MDVKETSLIYATFATFCVDIVVKSVRAKMNGITTNMVMSGYLLDECSEYFYIGDNVNEVSAAVKKTEVVSISLTPEELSRFESELNSNGDIQ